MKRDNIKLGDRKGSYYKRTKMDSEEGTGEIQTKQ